jgi:hypothetical protein
MADTNVAIKLFKTSETSKKVGININKNTASITDVLHVNGNIGVMGARYRYVNFYNNSLTGVGSILYDSGHTTNVTTGKFSFYQFSGNSTASTTTSGHYERYNLPITAQGLTASASYTIITTKNISDIGTIPITQGGTGKTTAADAWTALGGGASGKHADSYFALASHTHSYAGSSSAG